MTRRLLTRRHLLAGGALAAPALLTGCDSLGQSPRFRSFLETGEYLSYRVQRLLGGNALVREYAKADMSPDFRTNGNTSASSGEWQKHAKNHFADWSLQIRGLVERPGNIPLAKLRARPARTQITRHDCVEGWSAIGQWTGVPLGPLLDDVGLKPQARYIVFHCADDFRGIPYYESIDLADAYHPQTILAYGMNGADLPLGHGAPLRLRVERQIGYKQAKFVTGIEAVESLADTGKGRGGFWEDVGFYAWYAGV